MKKSLIVLGILAGITGVAQAENKTILYGSLGYSIGFDGNINKKDNAVKGVVNGLKNGVEDNIWDLKTSTAKFGIKGQEDINSGLQATYKFEFGVDDQAGVNETKKAHIGLKGGFGEVTLGNQGNAYKGTIDYNDTFNELTPGDYHKQMSFNKGVKYAAPDTLRGFGFTGSINLDGSDAASKGVDGYEVTAAYGSKDDGVYAGVGYQRKLEVGNGSKEVFGGVAGFAQEGVWKAGIGGGHVASGANFYNVGGQYQLGANTFRAGVAYDDDKGKSNDYLSASLGYQYDFSKRTYTWVEGNYTDYRDNTVKDDGYKVVVGIRHDF